MLSRPGWGGVPAPKQNAHRLHKLQLFAVQGEPNMGRSALILALIAAAGAGPSIPRTETEIQESVFKRYWNDDFTWRFEDLPTKGNVPKGHVPYSGYIYLDKRGGTTEVLSKYDRAMNRGGRSFSAASWERSDTSEARRRASGLFRWRSQKTNWYGHCNGWAAASIRHAEPQKIVVVNGVRFTPADIKGLLAELYMYNDHEMLAGIDSTLNAGALHAILANWLGRGSHPIAMDGDPTEEKWNYPIYAFASSCGRQSHGRVEVKTNIVYAKDSEDSEHDESPDIRRVKSFHYMLNLNERGDIVGGYYFRDSDKIDFLWVPLCPKRSGEKGNEAGNPYIDVDKVLAIWRKSVSRETRRQWLIVDPAEEDRAVEVSDPTRILPRNIKIVPPTLTADSLDGDKTL